MGLIKALAGATGGVLADQWKEYIYCEAMNVAKVISHSSLQKNTMQLFFNQNG